MKTKLEIIDETVKYYRTHKRAATNEKCVYCGPRDQKCAVGRCMAPNFLKIAKQHPSYFPGVNYLEVDLRDFTEDYKALDDTLLPEYRGHEIEFWADLQDFHDTDSHWIERGRGQIISAAGAEWCQEMRERWGD